MGTIVHKVMQTLGDKKLAIINGEDFVEDEETGKKISLEDCDNIELLNDIAFDYYSSSFPEVNITEADRKTCKNGQTKRWHITMALLTPEIKT